MSWFDWGNPPIHSDSTVVSAPSTATLIAELDSTVLGTVNLATGVKLPMLVTWILGADTNVTWKLESALSTGLGATATIDVIHVKTPTGQSGQYTSRHDMFKDYRLRARLASTGANASAAIQAEVMT